MTAGETERRDGGEKGPGWGTLGPLALVLVGLPAVGAVLLVASSERWLDPLLALDPVRAAPLFLAISVLALGYSLAPTHAASLVAGMAFGAVAGSGVALAAVAGAAWVGFATLRPLYAARGKELLADRPRARTVHAALVGESGRRAATLVALLRLSPVMPFAGTNLVMAAAGLRTRDFLFGSIIGLAPRVVAVAIAGAGLSELDLSRAGDVRLAILGVVALVLAFVLSARFARRALREAAPAAS